MATTYDPSLTVAPSKDRARLLLGDTGEDLPVWLLQDETIIGMLGLFPFSEAVAQLATALATRHSRRPTWYEDEAHTRLKWEDRVGAWFKLADAIRLAPNPEDVSFIGGLYNVGTLPYIPQALQTPFGVPGMRTGAEDVGRYRGNY